MDHTIIPLKLPEGSKQLGNIYDNWSQDMLDEDILQITFPNGYGLDVSHYPAYGNDGNFHIIVFCGDWESLRHHETVEVNGDLAARLEALAVEWAAK